MATTRRQSILEVLITRLELVQVVNGFATDTGAAVYFGEVPALGFDDPEQAIALVVGVETPQWMQDGKKFQILLPVNIAAVAKADLSAPYLVVEQVIGDIKRAIELEDRYLGGLVEWPLERGPVQTLTREPGSTTVGAAVTFAIRYTEGWGNP